MSNSNSNNDPETLRDRKISPLLNSFPNSLFKHHNKFGMEIAQESHQKISSSNTIFDISHLPTFTLAGLDSTRLITENFNCGVPELFSCKNIGREGKIGKISSNQFLIVDSLDGQFTSSLEQIGTDYENRTICLRTDLAEIALVGDISRVVLEELTGLNSEIIKTGDFLPTEVGSAAGLVIPINSSGKHLRMLFECSDANYIFSAIEKINNRLKGNKEGAQAYLEIFS
mgnify:CR=1 FL=1